MAGARSHRAIDHTFCTPQYQGAGRPARHRARRFGRGL